MTNKITRPEMLAEEMARFCLERMLEGQAFRLLEIDFSGPRFAFGLTVRKILVRGHVETVKGEGAFHGEMAMSRTVDNGGWQPLRLELHLDSPTILGLISFDCDYDDPKSVHRKLVMRESVINDL